MPVLLQISSLTLNNLHYISKTEKRNFGTVIRLFVPYLFAYLHFFRLTIFIASCWLPVVIIYSIVNFWLPKTSGNLWVASRKHCPMDKKSFQYFLYWWYVVCKSKKYLVNLSHHSLHSNEIWSKVKEVAKSFFLKVDIL